VSRFRWFSSLLAALLIGLCWLGNALKGDPHLVSVFPSAVSIIAFPLALCPALRLRARMHPADSAELRRVGWGVVWPASIAFAAFVVAFMAYRFGGFPASGLALAFGGTLVLSLLFGWLSVLLCVLLVRKSADGSTEAVA
jgi:hypothetical protein